MFVPNASRAVIHPDKLISYCLDPNHEVGGHKAVVFQKVLGITKDNAGELAEALLNAVQNSEAQLGALDEFGQRYVVDFEMKRGERRATVRSVWIIDAGADFPRLVTCLVL